MTRYNAEPFATLLRKRVSDKTTDITNYKVLTLIGIWLDMFEQFYNESGPSRAITSLEMSEEYYRTTFYGYDQKVKNDDMTPSDWATCNNAGETALALRIILKSIKELRP